MKEFLQIARVNEKKDILLYTLFLFLPLSVFFANLALAGLLLVFLFDTIKERKSRLRYVLHFLPFFIYLLVLSIIKDNLLKDSNNFKILLPLLLLPLALENFDKEKIKIGLMFLSFGVLIIQLISIVGIITYSISESNNFSLRNNSNINEVLHYERPYLGFFSALNFIIHYFLWKEFRKIISLASMILSSFLVILISARLASIIVFMALLFIIWEEFRTKRKMILIVSCFVSIILCFSIYISNFALKQRFQMIQFDSRIIIWNGGLAQLDSIADFMFGLGSQSIVDTELNDFYKNEAEFEYIPDKTRFVKNKYNIHNQYLNELIRGGVVGLALFISPFLLALFYCLKSNYFLPALSIIAVMIFLFVENLLERQIGVYTLSILLIFALKHNYDFKST